MGTSHSEHQDRRKKLHSSSKFNKRSHSVGGTFRISMSSSNTKAESLPVGNQYKTSKENPQEEYYMTTTNTFHEFENKKKQQILPQRQNYSFTRRMSQKKLPRRISLQNKHTSDITYEKTEEKTNEGNEFMNNFEQNLVESDSSINKDNYVVKVFPPGNQTSKQFETENKLVSSQLRQITYRPSKFRKQNCQQITAKLKDITIQSKPRINENPYANQYGSFY